MNTSSEFDTDVVVVGSGPMGGTTALALATYGVRVHVVSKWNWVANTPRAHIINQRAVEVLAGPGRRGGHQARGHPVGPDGGHPVHHQPRRSGGRPVADLGHRR